MKQVILYVSVGKMVSWSSVSHGELSASSVTPDPSLPTTSQVQHVAS